MNESDEAPRPHEIGNSTYPDSSNNGGDERSGLPTAKLSACPIYPAAQGAARPSPFCTPPRHCGHLLNFQLRAIQLRDDACPLGIRWVQHLLERGDDHGTCGDPAGCDDAIRSIIKLSRTGLNAAASVCWRDPGEAMGQRSSAITLSVRRQGIIFKILCGGHKPLPILRSGHSGRSDFAPFVFETTRIRPVVEVGPAMQRSRSRPCASHDSPPPPAAVLLLRRRQDVT
jgi:hypothetical protein